MTGGLVHFMTELSYKLSKVFGVENVIARLSVSPFLVVWINYQIFTPVMYG